MKDEREGNGRWWEKECEPGCPSVILTHAYTFAPFGLFQRFLSHQT